MGVHHGAPPRSHGVGSGDRPCGTVCPQRKNGVVPCRGPACGRGTACHAPPSSMLPPHATKRRSRRAPACRAPTGRVCLSRSAMTRPQEQGGEGGARVGGGGGGAPPPRRTPRGGGGGGGGGGGAGGAPLRHTGSPCPRPLAWRRPATRDRGPACRALTASSRGGEDTSEEAWQGERHGVPCPYNRRNLPAAPILPCHRCPAAPP
jgi:hypothetical protein